MTRTILGSTVTISPGTTPATITVSVRKGLFGKTWHVPADDADWVRSVIAKLVPPKSNPPVDTQP